MTTHKVKSWAHFFDAIKAGKKLHDLRKLDRDYKVGDILILQRYDNINGEYTGEELEVEITYITSNKVPCAFSSSALDRDYGIFSLRKILKKDVELFVPFPSGRGPNIVIKDGYASGGPVKSDKAYLVGETVSEQYIHNTPPSKNFGYIKNG